MNTQQIVAICAIVGWSIARFIQIVSVKNVFFETHPVFFFSTLVSAIMTLRSTFLKDPALLVEVIACVSFVGVIEGIDAIWVYGRSVSECLSITSTDYAIMQECLESAESSTFSSCNLGKKYSPVIYTECPEAEFSSSTMSNAVHAGNGIAVCFIFVAQVAIFLTIAYKKYKPE